MSEAVAVKLGKVQGLNGTAQALLSCLPLAFYLANLYRMSADLWTPYWAMLFIAGSSGLMFLFLGKRNNRVTLVLFILVYAISGFFNWLIIGNVRISEIMAGMLFTGIAVLMLMFRHSYLQGLIAYYLGVAVFIKAYISGEDIRSILSSSQNYISVLLILTAALYYIGLNNSKRTLKIFDLLPSVLCFLLSIWAEGRAGILSSGVLLLLMVLLYLRTILRKRAIRSFVVAVLLLFVLVVLVVSDIGLVDQIFSLGRLGTRGLDNSARERLWSAYFSKINESISYLMYGAPLEEIAIIRDYASNTHNSFMQLHAYNGLIMFSAFLYLFVRALKYYIKTEKMELAVVLIVIALRGLTDSFIFGQYGMPIVFYLILNPIVDRYRARVMRMLSGHMIAHRMPKKDKECMVHNSRCEGQAKT